MKQELIKYRRTRPGDLLEAFRLVTFTSNDLRKKSGMQPVKFNVEKPSPLMTHLLKTDPAGSFVAENASGKIVGFSMSQIREEEWYLAFLFVLPAYQSKGVGQRLLAKAMKYGSDTQCKRHALATYAYNPQAIAVYSKLGMVPQRPILMMGRMVDGAKVTRKSKARTTLTPEVITDERRINPLTRLDRRARQLARPEEHFFWINDPASSLIAFYDGKTLKGYSVVSTLGLIGPVVASKPEDLASIMEASIEFGIRSGQTRQALFVHGEQSEVIARLLAAGFKVMETNLLMATEKITDPSLYIPGHLAIY